MKKSFKEFYSEFDEVNEDEYHYVTMEQLRQIFTEEEINQHFKDGSIVDESEMVNEFLGKNIKNVQSRIRKAIPSWITEQPEMVSLGKEGQLDSLNSQFGLRFGSSDSAVLAIANAVADSTQVKVTKLSFFKI